MAVLFTIYLFVVIALPLALGVAVSYRNLCRSRSCPICDHETIPTDFRLGRFGRKLWFHSPIQRRWCAHCGWQGLARLVRPAQLATFEHNLAAAPPTAGCRTEPVRTLRLTDGQWRVLLQSWDEQGWYFGQLMFIGPDGHLHRDPTHPITGPTRADVFEQALSLSDHLLTYRLRELVSD